MEDTIAAVATAQGEGGIGIVRISGEHACQILQRLFVPIKSGKNQKKSAEFNPGNFQFQNRLLHYGYIRALESGEKIDEVLAVCMYAPHTYTRENLVEIHCHGSIVSLRTVLEEVLHCGARLAEQGEFTKRAFLNGRIDLSQAEAVIDLIKAKTEKSYSLAFQQLEGKLSARITGIRDEILKLLSHIIVNIDYPDADIEEITYGQVLDGINDIMINIEQLIDTSHAGRFIREGIRVVILGRPNVGKSSLMNALLRENRAIVTEVPGTTRDTIEEIVSIRGIPVLLIDTAGIRDTDHIVEQIGIQRTRESIEIADLVLFVLDGAIQLTEDDIGLMESIQDKRVIVLINKVDLGQILQRKDVSTRLPKAQVIETSMIREEGIAELEGAVEKMVYTGQIRQDDTLLITNVRHIDLLRNARIAMQEAKFMTLSQEALDFIEMDIRRAWELLGEITGDAVSEDIVDQVFSRFCLGK